MPSPYDVHSPGRSAVARRRVRLAVLAVGTAGGLVSLFHFDGGTSPGMAPTSAAGGQQAEGDVDPGPAATGGPAGSGAGAATGAGKGPDGGGARSGRGAGARTSKGTGPGAVPAVTTRSVLGAPADTRWGTVQVKLRVRNGKVVSSTAVQSPHGSGTSLQINTHALPILAKEAVRAQNAMIDGVSGATVTSGGYRQSLQSALDTAHLG